MTAMETAHLEIPIFELPLSRQLPRRLGAKALIAITVRPAAKKRRTMLRSQDIAISLAQEAML